MDCTKHYTHIEFAAGYGGIQLGLERAIGTVRLIAACEIEAYAVANLVSKMEAGLMDTAPIWSDIKTFPGKKFRGKVDILSAGYPCQPFSAAGKRKGTDDPRHLWPHIATAVRVIQPTVCFFENVEGHITLGLNTVLSDLGELGYDVEAGIFSAAEVGAPHSRKRVFIMGIRRGCELVDTKSKGFSRSRKPYCQKQGCEYSENRGSLQYGASDTSLLINTKELGDSSNNGFQGGCEKTGGTFSRCEQRGMQQFEGTGDKLGNPEYHGLSAGEELRSDEATGDTWIQKKQTETEQPKRTGKPFDEFGLQGSKKRNEQLSDTEREGLQRCKQPYTCIQESRLKERLQPHGTTSQFRNSWPSRPNEPQYPWEPPRVVGDPASWRRGKSRNKDKKGERSGTSWASGSHEEQSETQPPMGRNTDGTTDRLDYAELCEYHDNRTDELRLLGNGVVPATAEKAFLTLYNKLRP